jgi:radical SAM protein with 4Fe4S-binding SPASM domain
MLPTVVGNLRERTLDEIWHTSPLIRALRDRSNLTGWCHTCRLREKCGGCRGVAYSYTGDPLAADPRCWLYAAPDEPPTPRPAAAAPIQITRSQKGASQ